MRATTLSSQTTGQRPGSVHLVEKLCSVFLLDIKNHSWRASGQEGPRGIGSGCEAHSARTRHITNCIKQGYKTSGKAPAGKAPEHARVHGSVPQLPLSTFNSCLVSRNPCPTSAYQPPPPPPSLRFLGSIRVWMRGRWKGLPLAEAAVGRFLFILSFPSLYLTKRRPRCRPERERKRETRRQRERVRESEREGERERVLFIGTQFSILYTSMYSSGMSATSTASPRTCS